MFVRNLLQPKLNKEISLKAGDYISVVPFGLNVTIQYNDKGLIQKVFKGHDNSEWKDATSEYLPIILKNKQLPNKLPVTGGTTLIRGAFVKSDVISSLQKNPKSLQQELEQLYSSDPTSFKFYGGDISTNTNSIKGALSCRRWLSTARIELLPGYSISRELTDQEFEHMLLQNYPFQYPLISGYILFHSDGSIEYPKVQITQSVVKGVTTSTNISGCIEGNIEYEDGSIQLVPYSQIVKYNIQSNTLVLRDANLTIIHTIAPAVSANKRTVVSNKIQCSCCGRNIIVPPVGDVMCSDEQCNTRLYPRVMQLCKTLKIPCPTFEEYKVISDNVGTLFTVLDMIDKPIYTGDVLHITMEDGLRAIIPKSILPGMQQITQLADNFSNSIQTLCYYIRHVDKMKSDLSLDNNAFNRFYTWISSPENCSDVIEFFKLSSICIEKAEKRFDGPPIFRDKTIMLTGSFLHGSLDEVSSILKSYSANVTTEFSKDIDCLIIGDTQENLDGHSIITARKSRIPVMTESEFFHEYDIDTDIAENL